jgi:hypothetical protein
MLPQLLALQQEKQEKEEAASKKAKRIADNGGVDPDALDDHGLGVSSH